MIVKTYAFIVRQVQAGLEILVFRHREFPDAGVQVPGGSVEAGEELEAAVLREVFEESGLEGLPIGRYLGAQEEAFEGHSEPQMRHFFELNAPEGCPDTWAHTVSKGEEDAGMVFLYEWWPVARAERDLSMGRAGLLLGQYFA